MATDTFVDIKDEPGGATAKGMEGMIEVLSTKWSVSNPSKLRGQRATFTTFDIVKRTDKSSTQLFIACANGQKLKEMRVTIRAATGYGGQNAFLEYHFTDVTVERFESITADGISDLPTESISFGFSRIEIAYHAPQRNGGTQLAGQAAYDLAEAQGV